MSAGIDYGCGSTNIDHATGIRYGMINTHDLAWWHENAEADYGEPSCPKCGGDVEDSNDHGQACQASDLRRGGLLTKPRTQESKRLYHVTRIFLRQARSCLRSHDYAHAVDWLYYADQARTAARGARRTQSILVLRSPS